MTSPSHQDQWSQEDMLTLINSMRTTLSTQDKGSYKITLSHIDWDKLAFKKYTGPMCCQKWDEISNRIRKFRTLTEVILDTEEHVKNPYKGIKLKNRPDFPKRPLAPYFRFFIENIAEYETMHPEMSHAERSKLLSLIYKELPEEKKKKYIADYEREKQEFDRNVDKFREEHPDLMESTMKSQIPQKRKCPQQEEEACLASEPDLIGKRNKRKRQRKKKNVTPLQTV